MPIERVTRKGNTVTYWTQYSRDDIVAAWSADGQGRTQSIARGPWCVVQKCTQSEAVQICQFFIKQFAIPTCTHYDGSTVSLFCLDAGSGADKLRAVVRSYIAGLLSGKRRRRARRASKADPACRRASTPTTPR